MDKLKGFFKSEAHKYQQKFMGSSESAPPNHGSFGGHGHHVDPQHCRFHGRPLPQAPYNTSSPHEVKIASVEEIGNIRSLTTNVVRDLGFAGQIGEHVLLSYGDTLYANRNNTVDSFRGMTSNSVALATLDPLKVMDSKLNSSNGYPEQFVAVNPAWGEDMATWAVGITNVIETNAQNGQGVLFTLLNYRKEAPGTIIGAGLATVQLSPDANPVPHASRVSQYIWDGATEPWWGDCGAVKTADYVYAYGHRKGNMWVYVTRVKIEDILNVDAYEYWHGKQKGWSSERLKGDSIGEEQSVFWNVNQGQVIWSPYLEKFLFLYTDNFMNSTVLLRHADFPEGPYSDVINVKYIEPLTKNSTIYAAAPQPHFDPSGKTLVVSYTNHPNEIQAIKIEFE